MCRMLALWGDPDAVAAVLHGDLPEEFQRRCRRHRSGWGVGWYEGNAPRAEHRLRWVVEDDEFLRRVRALRSGFVLIHVRRATRGRICLENLQPFTHGPWMFAHNGTIVNPVTASLRDRFRPATRGDTDSEVFFHAARAEVEAEGEGGMLRLTSGIARANPTARLNCILFDGERLMAYRRGHGLFHFTLRLDEAEVAGFCSYPLRRGWTALRREELALLTEPGRSLLRLDGAGAVLAATRQPVR